MGYRLLITVILILHFGFLAYLAAGGFLAWHWPRTIWLHLTTAAWGLLVTTAGVRCPLTTAEHWSRRRAGQANVDDGFIDRYLEGVVYPERYAVVARLVLAAAVLVSWAGFVAHHRRGRARQHRQG